MIRYNKSGLKIAELHFRQDAPLSGIDIVRYQSRAERVEGANCSIFHTIHLDLAQPEDRVFGQMNSTKRNLVRRAEKEGVRFDFFNAPGESLVSEFFAFYDQFAALKKLPPANRSRILGMRDSDSLALTRAISPEGETIVWHCYVTASGSARLLHSASLYRASADKNFINFVSRANCYLHWAGIRSFQQNAFGTYDLGGWYAGSDDAEKLSINTFKEGFGGSVVQLYNADKGRTVRGVLAMQVRRAIEKLRGGEK